MYSHPLFLTALVKNNVCHLQAVRTFEKMNLGHGFDHIGTYPLTFAFYIYVGTA